MKRENNGSSGEVVGKALTLQQCQKLQAHRENKFNHSKVGCGQWGKVEKNWRF